MFEKFRFAIENSSKAMVKNNQTLFITDMDKNALWETYLDSFPAGTNEIYKKRREYDCNHCRHFIKQFGNVVAVKDNVLVSVWDVPDLEYPYNLVAHKLSEAVKSAPILNVFMSKFSLIGVQKNVQLLESGSTQTWKHFCCDLPKEFVAPASKSVEAVQGEYRDSKNVFKRSLDELTADAGRTILELIDQDSLYRGAEHKKAITEFLTYKNKYDSLPDNEKDTWCWIKSIKNSVARIRNTAVGTLLIDLSEGVDLDVAVGKFEKVMAPTNYKRPTAIFTKRMIEDAQKQIEEMGYNDSLGRRFAVTEDITVNNVLFVDRDARKKMSASVFDDLKEELTESPKTFNKVEEVTIEEFITNILPTTKNIELMLEGRHQGNLVSLIAPLDRSAPSMLKWDNNFGWSYNGDIADSMKQNVKAAGGNVDGVLRFSIQWNDGEDNMNDFDAHCHEPKGNLISYMNKSHAATTGQLDVDIINPVKGKPAVENITWTDINRMEEGKYVFLVHNYTHRSGKGFSAEIEYGGEIYSYTYNQDLRQGNKVTVAEIMFSRKEGIKFISSMDSTTKSKEMWGVKTNKFTKVAMCMFSPNYWDGQKGIGNRHYFFVLEGCKNETQPRGFFNEFLKDSLTPHRKVFEALGSKMRVEPSDNQLSGVGFSSTQRNSVVAKIDGSFTRTIKINF